MEQEHPHIHSLNFFSIFLLFKAYQPNFPIGQLTYITLPVHSCLYYWCTLESNYVEDQWGTSGEVRLCEAGKQDGSPPNEGQTTAKAQQLLTMLKITAEAEQRAGQTWDPPHSPPHLVRKKKDIHRSIPESSELMMIYIYIVYVYSSIEWRDPQNMP